MEKLAKVPRLGMLRLFSVRVPARRNDAVTRPQDHRHLGSTFRIYVLVLIAVHHRCRAGHCRNPRGGNVTAVRVGAGGVVKWECDKAEGTFFKNRYCVDSDVNEGVSTFCPVLSVRRILFMGDMGSEIDVRSFERETRTDLSFPLSRLG